MPTLSQFGIINERSLGPPDRRSRAYDRGNAYISPNAYTRATKFGVIESLSCANAGGEEKNPDPSGEGAALLRGAAAAVRQQAVPASSRRATTRCKPAPGPYDGSKPARP